MRWMSRSSPSEGDTVASMAMTRATGSGQRTSFHTGVVSRHTNNDARNHVRYSGSRRVMGRSGTPSVQRVKKVYRSEEHTSELQSRENLVCRLLLEKKK